MARVVGIGALIAGGFAIVMWLIVIALMIGPLVFWLAWNVLDLGQAVGLPELGFWATVLATLFLVIGWFGKAVIAAIVFLADPNWFQASAELTWPEPSFKHFIAVLLLAGLASLPHTRDRRANGSTKRSTTKRRRHTIIDVAEHN